MHMKIVVLVIKPFAFLPFSLPSPSSLRQLPNQILKPPKALEIYSLKVFRFSREFENSSYYSDDLDGRKRCKDTKWRF